MTALNAAIDELEGADDLDLIQGSDKGPEDQVTDEPETPEEPELTPYQKRAQAILGKYGSDPSKIAAAKAHSDTEAQRLYAENQRLSGEMAQLRAMVQQNTQVVQQAQQPKEPTDEEINALYQENPSKAFAFMQAKFQKQMESQIQALAQRNNQTLSIHQAAISAVPELADTNSEIYQVFDELIRSGEVSIKTPTEAVLFAGGLQAALKLPKAVDKAKAQGAEAERQRQLQIKRQAAASGRQTPLGKIQASPKISREEAIMAKNFGMTPEQWATVTAANRGGNTTALLNQMRSKAKKGK